MCSSFELPDFRQRDLICEDRFHFLVVTILRTAIAGAWHDVAAGPSKILVFEGTVTSIRTIDHPLTRWLVTVKIKKVISGEFSGSTFQFAVHSPARSGLERPWLRRPLTRSSLK